MNMLQIIRAAAAELGIPQPGLVVGIKNTDTIQLLALLNGLGGDLQHKHIWEALCTEHRFSTQFLVVTGTATANSAVITNLSASTGLDATYQVLRSAIAPETYVATLDSDTQVTLSQPALASGPVKLMFCKTKYTLPDDYDRMQPATQWDVTRHWEMNGPLTAQEWRRVKSGVVATAPRISWRILGSMFQTWPPVASAEALGFEYIGKAWARSAVGVAQTEFLADNDTCIYPDRLMITGLKMRYQQAKGLGFDFVDEFNEQLSTALGSDAGSETLSMAPRCTGGLIGWDNLPDSGYGD